MTDVNVVETETETERGSGAAAGEDAAARLGATNDEHSAEARDEKLVPVDEARRYRKRAQAAERALAEVQRDLHDANQQLQEREKTITQIERRQQIDEVLRESDAIDLEATRLLTELTVAQMDEPDVEAAVAELKQRKPLLFRPAARTAGAMSPRVPEHTESHALQSAAQEASATGARRDLLRYLRLRRRT